MPGPVDKKRIFARVDRDQLRRSVVLGSATVAIVILGILANNYTHRRVQVTAGRRVQTITLTSNHGLNPLFSTNVYRFSSVYTTDNTNHRGKLPPTKSDVSAPSVSQAIETFANKYSLTVDAVENNYASYITRDGREINTNIKLVSNRHKSE